MICTFSGPWKLSGHFRYVSITFQLRFRQRFRYVSVTFPARFSQRFSCVSVGQVLARRE